MTIPRSLLNIVVFISVLWPQEVSCSNEIEYYPNDYIEFCILAREDTLSGEIFPSGTGIHFSENGIFDWCFLQQDTNIQGHLCRGNGHNFMTSFHPNGKLKTCWLADDELIQGIPCSKFRFISAIFVSFHGKSGQTSFHENGELQYCELSENLIIEGKPYNKTDAVRFDHAGDLLNEY